jgi:hypothetical protein
VLRVYDLQGRVVRVDTTTARRLSENEHK